MYDFDSCYIENYCLQSVTELCLLTVMKHIYAWYYSVLSWGGGLINFILMNGGILRRDFY